LGLARIPTNTTNSDICECHSIVAKISTKLSTVVDKVVDNAAPHRYPIVTKVTKYPGFFWKAEKPFIINGFSIPRGALESLLTLPWECSDRLLSPLPLALRKAQTLP